MFQLPIGNLGTIIRNLGILLIVSVEYFIKIRNQGTFVRKSDTVYLNKPD